MKKLVYTLLLLAATAVTAGAQDFKAPQPSAMQTLMQEFGLGKITVTYYRPNVNGRNIFADLAPYGQVWRTGANNATTISFTDEVSLNGNKVAPGEYALFTIPGPDEWIIILNKTAKQWGAYSYKQADDVLRFKVKPVKINDMVETFTMQFANVRETTCQLHLMWEHTAVMIKLTTDVDSQVTANIAEAMKGENKPYYAAAQYYYNNNKDLNQALAWINEADKASPNTGTKLWKARIQLKTGNKAAALITAQEGERLAKATQNAEYARLNEAVIAQAK